jgi:hypothetical protein
MCFDDDSTEAKRGEEITASTNSNQTTEFVCPNRTCYPPHCWCFKEKRDEAAVTPAQAPPNTDDNCIWVCSWFSCDCISKSGGVSKTVSKKMLVASAAMAVAAVFGIFV